MNSPLIRRRNKKQQQATLDPDTKTDSPEAKSLLDSDSDEDSPSDQSSNKPDSSGFTNLESFQKKILRQKLKKLNNPGSLNATTGPYPSPPPAPQRVPNPPRKNLQHATGLLQPSTPLLPRRALRKGLNHPGATPTCTPNPTPNTKRRGLNALLQQYHQNQVGFLPQIRKETTILIYLW